MKSVNKVFILGNVGKDPEIRATTSGIHVANFSVATAERQKDKEEVTTWHNIVAFGRTAEVVRDYLKKGHQVFIEGRIQTRSWESDGEKKYRTEIIVNELTLLSGKTSGSSEPSIDDILDDKTPF